MPSVVELVLRPNNCYTVRMDPGVMLGRHVGLSTTGWARQEASYAGEKARRCLFAGT